MREEKQKERPQTLLEELCGADAPLYSFLRSYLYHNPLTAVSKKDLATLVEEAEESGDFRRALDKAIFEGTQNPDERQRHVEVIRSLAEKAADAAEQAKRALEEEGVTERAASLGRRIEDYRFMRERAGDILAVASVYYGERRLEREQSARREERKEERKQSEREERAIEKREKGERASKRKERRKMSRSERREAKRRERAEDKASEDRRKVREEKRSDAEEEEQRIEESEETARDERRKKRRQD